MFLNPFSFNGRIGRLEYGISFFIAVFAYGVVMTLTKGSEEISLEMIVLRIILSSPASWFFYAQGSKRCHDIGNSGWWQLWPLYSFWLLVQKGESFNNEYGCAKVKRTSSEIPDPKKLDLLEKLHSLKEKGVITNEEFESRKKFLLCIHSTNPVLQYPI